MANIFGYIKESVNEGIGVRSVLFISGCHGACDECHNPESWDFDFGYFFSDTIQQNIINDIKKNPLIKGITFCGGEPFMSPLALLDFVSKIEKNNLNLDYWSYSGFTFEQIVSNKEQSKLLKKISVLIDGRFEKDKKDLTLAFRGSSNQRIIDVQKSLKENKVILYKL